MLPARIVLASLVALLAIGLWFPLKTLPSRTSVPGGDLVLYRSVVDRMRLGEPYYEAMRAELLDRGYPTASIFNWRAPGTFVLMARGSAAVHMVMLALGLVATVLTLPVFRPMPRLLTVIAVLFVLGSAAMPFVPIDGLYAPELWAGLFLLLSVLAHTRGAHVAAAAGAIAAVCARELALPYLLVALALAFHARRNTEVRCYVIGLAIFATYYVAHVVVAASHIHQGDMSHTRSWIAFGGWPFIVTTVATGGWYLLLPRWAAAIGAVVVLASLWSPADRHLKAVVLTYVALFSIVGQPFNNSWGLLTGPSWGLASAYGIVGLGRLIRLSLPASARQATRLPWRGGASR